ncbi:hypothetical protein FB45DRAFT_1122568 [Roridomyces roridus]|uniref:NACHT domain-containing protein n=1 Tax=Roridomyces roridus TaxID=1738132 RepID=A0AAD7B3Y6_9AGAR|nr:hypothetical protein FB45DRAFT_1122568 [Roridomyces roridus]
MASHRANRKRDALVDNAIPLLDFAADALDLVPIPGLSLIAQGLSLLITRVKDTRTNDDARRLFLAEAQLLCNTLTKMATTAKESISTLDDNDGHTKQAVLHGIAQSEDLQRRVESLKSTIQHLCSSADHLKVGKGASGFLKGLVYASGNAALLAEMKESLAKAVSNFQMEGQISIENVLAEVIQSAKDIRRALKDAEEQKVLDSIPRADAGYRCVDELKSGFFPGTRQELFKELNQWLDDPDQLPVYFLSGGAGLGKSSIAHQLCTRLDSSAQDGPSLGASFFFVRRGGELESARLFFSSLAHQLAISQPFLRPYIIGAAREYLNRGSRQQMGYTFHELFRHAFERAVLTFPKSVVVVIDGLDECGERGLIPDLLELLLELPTILPGIRIFLTARPEPYIQSVLTSASALPRISHHSLNDTVYNWQGDVRLYLEQTVPKIGSYGDFLRDNPGQLQRLIKRAAGVFNFARVAVGFLDAYHDHPEEQFALLLSDLGTGLSALDTLYLQILSSAFPPEGWSVPPRAARLRFFLVLIGLAREPLSPEAMAFFRLETQISKADIISMNDRLRSVLLINSDGRIIPLHATFTEFLLDSQRCVDRLYYVDRAAGSALLASACMGAFTFPTISDYIKGGERSPIRQYVRYAKTHWCSHLAAAQFNGSLKGDLNHFVNHQIPVYTRVNPAWYRETASGDLECWFSKGGEDGTPVMIEHAKSEAYHKLMWITFSNSKAKFPDVSAADFTRLLRRKKHEELAVRRGVDLTVTGADLVRFRAAHDALMDQIRAAESECVWLNPELGWSASLGNNST